MQPRTALIALTARLGRNIIQACQVAEEGTKGGDEGGIRGAIERTKAMIGIGGYSWNSTSPLCVHGDYSGAQPPHNPNHNSTITLPLLNLAPTLTLTLPL